MLQRLVLFFVLAFTLIGNAQTVNYSPSTQIFANPERGLQKYSKNLEDDNSYDLISQSELNGWRTGTDKITVVYRYMMLTPFMNSTISTSYLNNLQTDLDRIRNAGFKVILRPAYTNDYIANVQPSKAQILAHITQLASVVNTNKDVIVSVQAGFIGVYGEWYYTGGNDGNDTDGSAEFGDEGNISSAQWLNRKAVVDAMLTNFQVPIQLRYASAKKNMYGTTQLTDATAYQTTNIARIGFYNDAFLNNYGDMGTYDVNNGCTVPNTISDYAYIANASQYLPMNGESNGINPCNSNVRTTGANAVVELNALNFSTLNRDYHPSVWNGWIASGHYNEIVRNLGYRLQLNSTTINITQTSIDFTLNVTNTGYGNVLTQKKVYLVFRNTAGVEYKKLLNADPRFWKTTHTFTQTLLRDIPDGDYQLFLHIADFNLTTRAEYSIKLANSDIAFEATTGYNNLNQPVTLSSTCLSTTTWNGTAWTNGAPTINSIAIIDAPYTVGTTLPAIGIDCCTLFVNSSLLIPNNTYVYVVNDIHVNTVGGSLVVNSGGKLIPASDTSMSYGAVTVRRTTTNLKQYDYTYWSAPVWSATIGSALTPTNWQSSYIFHFVTENFYDVQTQFGTNTPTAGADGQDDDGNAWINPGINWIFQPARGYAAMGLWSLAYPTQLTVSFTGGLNTGIINYPMVMSQNTLNDGDDHNLVGNPYSSSIYAPQFLNENLANISGEILYWAHAGGPSAAYPGLSALNFSVNDYAYYNLEGGTNAVLGGKMPSDFIGSCQGFVVEAETATNLVFKPSMMAPSNSNSTNAVFFRNAQTDGPHKVWAHITTELGLYAQQLVSYSAESDLGFNKGRDTKVGANSRQAVRFYSIEGGENYKIQGRGQFNIADVVKLGYFTAVPETYTMALDSVVGIENVYVRDNGVLHELPYTFVTEEGTFNDRFELVYQGTLGTVDWGTNGNYLYPNPTRDVVNLVVENIENYTIDVFDVRGRAVIVEQNGSVLDISHLESGVYYIRLEAIDRRKTLTVIKE